jgi:hypothetical protein
MGPIMLGSWKLIRNRAKRGPDPQNSEAVAAQNGAMEGRGRS